jgi:ribosomal protein S7
VRRCWRFGQKYPVTVDIVTTEGGAGALRNLERKAAQADRMFDALTEHMRDALSVDRSQHYPLPVEVPAWLAS